MITPPYRINFQKRANKLKRSHRRQYVSATNAVFRRYRKMRQDLFCSRKKRKKRTTQETIATRLQTTSNRHSQNKRATVSATTPTSRTLLQLWSLYAVLGEPRTTSFVNRTCVCWTLFTTSKARRMPRDVLEINGVPRDAYDVVKWGAQRRPHAFRTCVVRPRAYETIIR